MASIKMYEILRSIRMHPFLRRVTEMDRLTAEESRKIDDKMTKK